MASRVSIKSIAVCLALTATGWGVAAQSGDFMNRSELLVAAGGMFYIGDLNQQSLFSLPHWAANMGLRYRFDNRWALRFEGAYGGLQCKQDYIEVRNLSFRTSIVEASALLEFNFRPYGAGATESQWTPYIFGGFGVFHFAPEALLTEADGTSRWVRLQPLHTEGQGTSLYPNRRPYRTTELCLPFGVGVKWRVSKAVSLTAEYGFRKTWTDYIDDVSTTYVGTDLLVAEVDNGGLAAIMADRSAEVQPGYVNAPGIKRGDDSLNDWYSYLRITCGVCLDTLLGWTRSKRCKN